MNAPSFDNTKSILLVGLVGIGAFFVYKAYKATQAVATEVPRIANQLGQTVRETQNAAMQGVNSALGTHPLTASTAQAINWWNNWRSPTADDSDLEDYFGDLYESYPDDFYAAEKRMAKPGLARLDGPKSRYVQ